MKKSVVLLSSGIDSAVNLFESAALHKVLLAITFDYGQRAAKKEIECSQKLTQYLGIPHKVLSLPWVIELGHSSLLDKKKDIPVGYNVDIDDLEKSKKTAQSVWVPNRNGIFLNIAAGYAESLEADWVIPGFNAEEAVTFSDNSEDFLRSLTKSFSFSTANKLEAYCFTLKKNKSQIVKRGQELSVPWSLTWPCYVDQDTWCGQCESCQRALRAFAVNGVTF